jgi:nudix-type nucleoside diphosphatase (YffH/AdpP family)
MTAATSLFFYGTLRHVPLLRTVLGRVPLLQPARLPDHAVLGVTGGSYPTIVPRTGAIAEGILMTGVQTGDLARLDYYEAAYHYALQLVEIETDSGPRLTEVYFPTADQEEPTGPWDLDLWVREHGAATTLAAEEVMAQMGRLSADEVKAGYEQMLVRASSAHRARTEPAPATVRRGLSAEGVEILDDRRPYTRYFALREQDVRFPKFDGSLSRPVTRAAFCSGDAVTVLPYDPVRDRVLLIEQYRFGVNMRGDPRPWVLEPVAGRIDPGETPEETARREALEEAGIVIGDLHRIGAYYPSPGAVSEWLISYVGIADLPDTAAGVGGLASEAEDIQSHIISFDQLMALLETEEAQTGPLVLTALWLAQNRARLA